MPSSISQKITRLCNGISHSGRICFTLAVVFVGCLTQQVKGDHFDCYILAGQSNMDGRGDNAKLTDDQVTAVGNAIIFYSNPPLQTETWQPLTPGFSRPPKFKGQLPSTKFGPEIGFVAEMRQANPDRKIAIIKASEGGTNLRSDWKPGTPEDPSSQGRCYQNLLQTVQAATNKLIADGNTFTLRAMLWHQGESDSKVDAALHQQRLTELIARIRTDCHVPDLPVVLGQVVDNGKRDRVRLAIEATASAVERVGLVTAKGLTTWDEGTHFDAASQLVLGQRFAIEALKMMSNTQSSAMKVVCFGDSITKRGYPELLGNLLNVEVVNAGVGGHTSRQGLHRMRKDVLDHQPEVVVIMFGTNDMRVDSKKHVSIDEFKKNLSSMVMTCEKNNSTVVLCSVPPINEEPYFTRHDLKKFQDAGGLQVLVDGYRDAAVLVSKNQNVTLVDLNQLLASTPEWMSNDGVHPSDIGSQIIAQHVADAIKKMLRTLGQ